VNSSKRETLMDLDTFVARVTELSPHLCRAMMRQEASCLHRGAITVPQLWALELIRERGVCPQQAVLDTLQLKASTGTVFMDRLCRQGLARRSRNPENRREVLLKVTRKGSTVLDEARNQRKQAFALLFKPLPAAQRRSYLKLLESIVRDFSENQGAKK
jgi:DNA-binding MarR family transcriptional regulator